MIKILLLEDNETEARSFTRRYSSSFISIKVVGSVHELFHEIDYQEFDLIIIDPVLSETLDFSVLLKQINDRKLKLVIAHPGEYLNEYYKQEAEKKNLQTVSLNDSEQIVGLLNELVKKKSSGGTAEVKKEQHQQEIKIIKIEMTLNSVQKETEQHGKVLEEIKEGQEVNKLRLSELELNQLHIKDTLNVIHEQVKDVAVEVDKIVEKDPIEIKIKDKEEETKRYQSKVLVYTALITGFFGLLVALAPHVIGWFKEIGSHQIKIEKGK